jgi:hypothetical protein
VWWAGVNDEVNTWQPDLEPALKFENGKPTYWVTVSRKTWRELRTPNPSNPKQKLEHYIEQTEIEVTPEVWRDAVQLYQAAEIRNIRSQLCEAFSSEIDGSIAQSLAQIAVSE